ncbi:hypothetical protein Y1Q_0009690 [Alligator mississippiensis]|uniref:Uncharacterized protein n=1 Tax=Alligator mississippiensis TaxID=8496 RepID=A0A151MWA3_ALLMI|nr:hypothetical protein Y1Q_0009690 [Alligator mississippiensis]
MAVHVVSRNSRELLSPCRYKAEEQTRRPTKRSPALEPGHEMCFEDGLGSWSRKIEGAEIQPFWKLYM